MRKSTLNLNEIEESFDLGEATADDNGALLIEFITPGWGSSGYYSREVVEAAAPLFAVGTHMYFDHPTEAEDRARPIRSVRDLAAVIVEAGSVNPATGGIVGKVKPLNGPYASLLVDENFTANVGVSIRASATDIVAGVAEGRSGKIIEGLAVLASVDFVTRAGRGGKVLQVLESALALSEATADDRYAQLQVAVKQAYDDGPGTWVWVCDQDADERIVYFRVSRGDSPSRTYQQTYTVAANDAQVELTGEATEVRRLTTYVPVNPAGPTPPQESKEDAMPKKEIEESEHNRLVEEAGRVPTLVEERDTARQERDEARTSGVSMAKAALAKARGFVAEANSTLPPATVERIVDEATATLPLKESGELDEEALKAAVESARTAEETYLAGLAVASGKGGVSGFAGGSPAGGEAIEAGKPTATPWGRPIAQEA